MIEAPLRCGKVAEPFPNRAAYYCDYCRKSPPNGTKLRWFTPSALVCGNMKCQIMATEEWELYCHEMMLRKTP